MHINIDVTNTYVHISIYFVACVCVHIINMMLDYVLGKTETRTKHAGQMHGKHFKALSKFSCSHLALAPQKLIQ